MRRGSAGHRVAGRVLPGVAQRGVGKSGDGRRGRGHGGLALGLARRLVSILGCLVADQGEDSPDDVGHDKLARLGLGEAAADVADVVEEAVDIVPLGAGDDLEEDVCGRDGARLRATDLSSLEEAADL